MNKMMTKCEQQGDEKVNLSIPLSVKPTTSIDQAQFLIQNHSNFKRSSQLSRFMFYQDGSWVDYESGVVELVKLGFGKGLSVVEAEIGGFVRLFDFYRMIEVDIVSGKHRSVAWIDVNEKCFFPKFFVSTFDDCDSEKVESDNDLVKVEIEIKLGENFGDSDGLEVKKSVKVSKRKREEEKEGSSSSFVAKRRETESQSARWRKTRALGVKEKGFTVVEKLFMSGLSGVDPGARVTAIHQCVRSGPMDKAKCQVFAKQMEITKRARGDSRMVFAWFGTSAKGVESVLNHGFGMSACGGVKNKDGPGVGVYLSPARSPQNSAMLSETDENGEKHVVLCRVILGRSEKVQVGSEQSFPSSVEYDTGVDDLANPNWYTVWHANMNTHILPECVVSYRPVKSAGLVNGMSTVNWMPHASVMIAKLIAKLKGLLPPPKISQLGTLCGMFKEGKLEKDGFMKQLRRVVGDDILRSTIQEIRG